MAGFTNPALHAFLAQLADGFTFVQVRIRPVVTGFDLRQVEDVAVAEAALAFTEISALRELAQTTAAGVFRPNKGAPTLRTGWRARAQNAHALETALRHLYPGGLADWFAGRAPAPPVTHYREFVARQTGLYRLTQILPDPLAAQTTRAGCAARFCLRQRLWTTPGLEPDPVAGKSALPCLEPCALLLDLARRAMKLAQEPKADFVLAESDVAVLIQALETALDHPAPDAREGNSAEAANPRRRQLLLEKLKPLLPLAKAGEG